MKHWSEVCSGVWLYCDSCNVYAVAGPNGCLLINAGTGAAAEYLDELPCAVDRLHLLLTHHFRDHSAGAERFKARGATIYGPYWDQQHLLDPEQHFRERQIWNSYDNRWDRYSPIEPVPVDAWMMDYETRTLAGLDITVHPSQGVTNGAVTYIVTVEGRNLAFVGELIHSPGKVARLAPLQYNYNDFLGAFNVHVISSELKRMNLDVLLPSLGEPMDDPVAALSMLQENILRLAEIQPEVETVIPPELDDGDNDGLKEFIPGRLYLSTLSGASTNFLISDSGKVLSLDYGYDIASAWSPSKHHFSTRRPRLHGLHGLERRFGIKRIDAVLLSHFHDDHVNGVPMLKRLFGTEVLAAHNFTEILEDPMRYDRPCLWPEPIGVDRSLRLGEPFQWEEFTITLWPMSGHTRFASLLCIEFDDVRLAHTGDQIFFSGPSGAMHAEPGTSLRTNHVYQNGLDMGCYLDTYERLRDFNPNWIATGHTEPYPVGEGFLEDIRRGAQAFDDVHAAIMPLGHNNLHFGAESRAAKLKPYRVHQAEAVPVRFDGWVINPCAGEAVLNLRIAAPEGWSSSTQSLTVAGREQVALDLTLTPPPGSQCRRLPVALNLDVDGRPYGQVCEALVTIGCDYF
jgi:glyoxylase-like metal-dependent hydrolase (beta-lactamase superfamily II)